MLSVTEEAREVLAKSLEASEAPENQSLRLERDGQGQFGLAFDEEREGDQVVEHAEKAVLLVAPETSALLDGAVLDVVATPEGKRLTLRMPESA